MIKLVSALAVIASLQTAYADDKDKDKDKEPDFSGSYSYTSTFTVSLTTPQAATMTDNETGHLTISESKKGGFVLTFSSKGETCELSAARVGKRNLKPANGQSCTVSDRDSGSEFTITLTSGSGNLAGDSLTMNLGWKLSGSVGGVAVTGRATEVVQAEQK